MIACFTTILSSLGCWSVWFDWRRNYTHVGHIVMDSCFFWVICSLLLISPVLYHTGAWCLCHVEMLSFLFLAHFTSNNLTNITWHNGLFLSAPQAVLFPWRKFCHLLVQLFISGPVFHMLFQIFNFNVVFDSSSLPFFLFGVFSQVVH